MTTAIDRGPHEVTQHAIQPQPLGFLPTRWFWTDPRFAGWARYILAFAAANVVLLAILLSPSWWVAGLAAAFGTMLAQGLIEWAIRRRFLSQPEQASKQNG
jgi:hypothetical protein